MNAPDLRADVLRWIRDGILTPSGTWTAYPCHGRLWGGDLDGFRIHARTVFTPDGREGVCNGTRVSPSKK